MTSKPRISFDEGWNEIIQKQGIDVLEDYLESGIKKNRLFSKKEFSNIC